MSTLFCRGDGARYVGRLSVGARERRIAELEDALRPFADRAESLADHPLTDKSVVHFPMPAGDIFRAQAVLKASSSAPPQIGPREGSVPAPDPPTPGGARGSRAGTSDFGGEES